MGALCTEFVNLSVGLGGDGERRGGVTNVGFFPSQRGQHRHIQSLALSHGGTAPLLIQLQTQTRGAGSWGEFHYRGRVLLLREGFQTRERNSRLGGKPRRTSWADPATDKPSEGRGKGRTHRVVAALISNHLNPGHAWSQRLGWREAQRIFVYWNNGSILNRGALQQLQEKMENPEQIPDAWLKPGLKIDKQPEDNLFHTPFTVGWGEFLFFQSNTEKKSQKIHLLLPQRPFHPKKGQWNTGHSHTHMDLVQNLVTLHLGSFLQL